MREFFDARAGARVSVIGGRGAGVGVEVFHSSWNIRSSPDCLSGLVISGDCENCPGGSMPHLAVLSSSSPLLLPSLDPSETRRQCWCLTPVASWANIPINLENHILKDQCIQPRFTIQPCGLWRSLQTLPRQSLLPSLPPRTVCVCKLYRQFMAPSAFHAFGTGLWSQCLGGKCRWISVSSKLIWPK